MQKIANRLGYQGDMVNFDNYLNQNPEKKRQMIAYEDAARRMAAGGYVRMQEGGTPTTGGMFGEFNPDNMVKDPGIGGIPPTTPIEPPTGTGELAGDLSNTIADVKKI